MNAEQILYIRLPQQKKIIEKAQITVGDLADVAGNKELCKKIEKAVVKQIKPNTDQRLLISFNDIARAVQKADPSAVLICVGAEETVVMYYAKEPKPRPKIEILKVIAICLILFVGSFMAIMTFHTDAAVPEMFIEVNRMITGKAEERPVILILSYSVGIAVGILVFFNHIGKKKITADPTPVQVQFAQYKKQIDDCVADELESEQS